MKQLFKSFELKRDIIKKIYWYTTLFMMTIFIILAEVYAKFPHKLFIWMGAFIIIVWPVITFIFIINEWSWFIKNLIMDYDKKNHVFSAAAAILLLFAYPFIIFLVLSNLQIFYAVKDYFSDLSTLFITAMPAFIGLLGVQYTVAVQERGRKEAQRLGAKPFLSVEGRVNSDKHTGDRERIYISIKITNISQNIGIPKKAVLQNGECTDFTYTPLAQNNTCEQEIIITRGFNDKIELDIYYQDVYKNEYKMHIIFIAHNKPSMSKTEITQDELYKLSHTDEG